MNQFEEIYNRIKDYSEMTMSECEFLYKTLRENKPKKILEIGVSSGASSALILDAIKDDDEAKLYSVDLAEFFYKDPQKKVGFLLDKNLKELKKKNVLYTGGVIADFIEEIGNDIDFVLLDAAHGIPGEVLDFLVILPYCKENAVFVVHDVNIQMVHSQPTPSMAPKILLLSVSAEKEYPIKSEHCVYNIAKFKINNETKVNIGNVFSALLTKWIRPMSTKQFESFKKILSMHYSQNLIEYFELAAKKFRYEEISNKKQNSFIKRIIKFLQKYAN